MELIDSIHVINRYQDYIDILQDEKKELKRLLNEKPDLSKLTILQKIEYRKKIWSIDAEILAKRQYIEQYRKRAGKA